MSVRKLLLFTMPFCLGAALCQYLLPDVWHFRSAVAVLVLGLVLSRLWKERRGMVLLLTVGLAAGIFWYGGYARLYLIPAESLVGTEDIVTLELLDYPEEKDYGMRCTVRILDRGIRGKAVYYGDGELLGLEPGSRLTVPVKCYSAVTVGQQESTYYTSRGVFLRMYRQGEPLTVESGQAGSLRYLPQRMGLRLRQTVEEIYVQPAAGFIAALLTGDREILGEQTTTDLEETGLMHITAVSGLHCGFFIAFVGVLLARRQRLTALVGYPVLLLYMVTVGATPSVVRACVMVGLMLFAPLLNREGDTPTSLAAAALLILLINPFAIASISFQMSFGAVAGLLAVSPKLYSLLGGGRLRQSRALGIVWNFAASTGASSIGCLLFTAPLSAIYFGYFSLVSLFSNLLVLWVAPVLFAGAFLVSLLCIAFPGLAFLAIGPELLARYVLGVANLLAKMPGHGVYFTGMLMLWWLIMVYAMLGICFFTKQRRGSYLLVAALALVTLSAVRVYPVLTVRDDKLTLAAVDVGQGAATLLHAREETALVDCGSLYSLRGPGGSVADTMATYGWKKLDYVILTHYHKDHAGGLEGLLARVEVGKLLLPQLLESGEQANLQREVVDLAAEYGVPITYMEAAEHIPLGEGALTIYPPLAAGDTNEEGLTVLCSVGDFDVLITGDMSKGTEKLLVETYDLPDTEVLLVGHHGSKQSTSKELLKAVTPEVGIISVGENRYGHPTFEAMERMAFYGMTLYRTDLQGTVLLQVRD